MNVEFVNNALIRRHVTVAAPDLRVSKAKLPAFSSPAIVLFNEYTNACAPGVNRRLFMQRITMRRGNAKFNDVDGTERVEQTLLILQDNIAYKGSNGRPERDKAFTFRLV